MSFLEDDMMVLRSVPLQKVYNFECMMPDVGTGTNLTVSTLVQSVNYGDYNMTEINRMNYGASQSFFAGLVRKGEFSITFVESENQDVKTYLSTWRGLIVDSNGRFQVKLGAGYARTITLNYTDDEGNTTNIIYFKNAFPVGYSNLELSYTSSAIQRISAQFVCDSLVQGVITN